MAEESKRNTEPLLGVDRLRKEHEKVVKDCDGRIQHWMKVAGDYEALDERLKTLPDQLSYDIMVPFGPLAFMPGKLVHTNEVTVLLGDNWFAKCSAKQAQKMVDHRMKYVKSELDDLVKTKKNFEARVGFAEDLQKASGKDGDYIDIREELVSPAVVVSKGKRRVAHKPNSKPKLDAVLSLGKEDKEQEENRGGGGGGGGEQGGGVLGVLSEEELWARLDDLEKQEEQDDEHDRMSDNADTNGEDTTTSSSSEEDKEGEGGDPVSGPRENPPAWSAIPHSGQVNGTAGRGVGRIEEEDEDEEREEEEDANCLPTIYFSHTVEPKKVRINTGKNTMLKFSERKEQKEQSKRKKNNGQTNGLHEPHKISSPTDVYRLFVDVKNGELVPRKSILKSRSRENSVCSDTSESSAADLEERRMFGRGYSHDDVTPSDTSDGITEEDSPTAALPPPTARFEAFSGTVVEKDPVPSSVPHLSISPPALPTIPERKQEEVAPEVAPPQEPRDPPKRVSKFKAARLQQK